MISKQPKVIALLSGKGGSGKSTVSISMAKIISDLQCSCLLVDFDLATNGASYFFQSLFSDSSYGIWEILASQWSPSKDVSVESTLVQAEENLYFVPSRARLRSKGLTYENLPMDTKTLKHQILIPLIRWAKKKDIKYVLIDCQAGYSDSSVVASEVADATVFVSEADSISSDAADNLLIQLGDKLPSERRFLINKIDVRDADTYRKMTEVFSTINRLPPLPYDYGVRNAFGARQMPVRTDEPSPVLFALFETMNVMLPELREQFERYRKEHIEQLFEEYNSRFDELVKMREHLEREKATLESRQERERGTSRWLLLQLVAVGSLVPASLGIFSFFVGDTETTSTVILLTGLFVVGLGAIGGLFYQRRVWKNQRQYEEAERIISSRLKEVEAQLDQYRSLLWSQSRDYLIDAQISREVAKRDLRSAPGKS